SSRDCARTSGATSPPGGGSSIRPDAGDGGSGRTGGSALRVVPGRTTTRTPVRREAGARTSAACEGGYMTKISIEALARQQIKAAHHAGGRRAADTVFGGHEKVLRQTVIGLLEGAEIGERDNCDE